MPEGDTVWRLARRLGDALVGHRLTRCDLRVPRLATVDLTGREVLDVRSRGKHLLTRFEGGLTLHSHLRMDGAWKIYAPAERWRGGPAHQIRAVLGTAEHTAVGYRLPVLDLLRTADESRVVGHLGPDLLGPDWDPERALGRLLSAPGRPLGEALLDQRNLAGIGNVYKSELCFLLRASPWLPVGQLPRPERLPALAKRLLEANKDRPARTTTPWGHRPHPFGNSGRGRPDRRLWVYGRSGRPCLRCGTGIRTADQDPADQTPATEERVTYWCPACQPDRPAARPTD
ncbi:endonuclease-8 [Streptomyces sp. 2224.1]|uniref:Fpg/Nei family DNA glycosylase n=1 Tax=unclassified Streptomyces TaxID=2593676 RepID=UPI0008871EB6|nr:MULTISPECIES: DNA-formamidopyrimidine glycosylase family protein [unclassified Streptomyces]PBC85432.1 endonuclease-8 [Streptomyces sp. 2321.6]SDR15210.1 endonuclease-8 [Streptomyces sp. KS_16]SED67835.1 endonuclease-8 [Streptomyces sp. 2133.1]SEE32248.1 endonuclease-8 [Streptomyces sp. 2224.1]SNC71733.1 endonuclease-8 [Streptomyces sp. 2114.4]